MFQAQKGDRAESDRVLGSHGRREGYIEKQGDARQLYTAEIRRHGDAEVQAVARLLLDAEEDTLRVTIRARGLEPGECHPQAVHAVSDALPSHPDDRDGSTGGVADRLFEFGPILLLLSPFPDADERGQIACEYLISLREQPEAIRALEPAQERMVVLYGRTVEGLYEPAMPVAWGQLRKRSLVRTG